MKKIFILIITLYSQAVFAQVISLEDALNYEINDQSYPTGTTYVKDINNRLDSFVGTWKGSDNGRLYEVNLVKRTYVYLALPPSPGAVRWDRLLGNILVKDSLTGDTLLNTLSNSDNNASFSGTGFSGTGFSGTKLYSMLFSGPKNGCYDYGDVSIIRADSDPTLMGMFYHRGGDLIDTRTCPGGYENYRTILPAKLHLRKQ